MSWGALAGLGQGMQQVGTILMDREKAKVAEELQQQREARAEERELAKETRQAEREAAKVASTREVQDGNRWVRRSYNATGDIIREEDLSPNEIAAIQRSQQKEEADISSKLATAEYNQARASGESTRQGLANALTQARIGTERARQAELGVRARVAGERRAPEAATPPTPAQAGVDLIKDHRTLVDSYTKAPAGETAPLTAAEVQELARASVIAAGKNGRDPAHVFQLALQEHARKKAEEARR